jgi:hypothetical protein
VFGGYLWRLVQWLGPWECYFAFLALAVGVWFGFMWRASGAHKRSLQRRAARAPRLCRDCRWAMPEPRSSGDDWRLARCMHPNARLRPGNFLVTGTDEPSDMNYCSNERDGEGSRCGPLARYWEPGPQLIAPAPPMQIAQ